MTHQVDHAVDDSDDDEANGRIFHYLPEIGIMLDKDDHMRASDLISTAAGLFGDGAGGELGENAEYERGISELILRYMGWPVEHIEEVTACIHAHARDLNSPHAGDGDRQIGAPIR